MKKIKIFVVLIFFLIISAVSNNVMAAGKKNMVCTDLIHIYNTSTNFDFTVTNNTTLDQIKNAYQSAGATHMLETDSCFGGHALSIWHDNYTDYLYVETVSNDEYVVSYGSVWNQFQTYEYDYDEVTDYTDQSILQGFMILEQLKLKGGVFYNRNRVIGSDLSKTSQIYETAYNNNRVHFQKNIAKHAVIMYIAISKVHGYKCNIVFDEDYFYINEQMKDIGTSLKEYIERMNKREYMSGLGTRDNTEITNGNYYFLNPAMYADMFITKPLNRVDRVEPNTIAVFDYNPSTKVLNAILVSPEVFSSYKNVDLTQHEQNLYSAGQTEYYNAINLLNQQSSIYSTNPVINPAQSLLAGTLLESKKQGIVSYFNAIRIAAGLPTVEASADHFTVAQHMATLMSYRWNSLHLEITHSPSKPDGVSQTFFDTAIGQGRGYAENISRSANDTSVYLMKKYVNMFLDDQTETPMNFSHRSLLLTPKFSKIGYGISPNIGVIEINGAQSTNVFLKAWPANGITFMETLENDRFYWTAQFLDNYTVDKSSTEVKVTCLNTEESWEFKTEQNNSSKRYEIRTTYPSELNNMLVFYDNRIIPKNNYVYEIEISGLKDNQGNNASYTYRSVFKYADINNIPTIASEIQIDKSNLSLVSGTNNVYYVPIGEETKLNVIIDPSVTDKKVSWASSNPEIATVTQNGTVTALRAGQNVAITLTYDADADVTDVVILKPYVKINQVTLTETSISMIAGQQEEKTLTIKTIPEEADEVISIDWVVVTQANPTTEYSYTDPQITRYLTITRIDDRNIRIKANSAEAGNNNFIIRAKVTGLSADFTGQCNVTVKVPLESMSFSNANQYNTGLSIYSTPRKPSTETINFNDFYSRNNTDIIRFRANYRPSNTTVSKTCTWQVISGTDVLTVQSGEDGAFKVKKPGQASILITSTEEPSITAQLDLTINCTLQDFTIAQPSQTVFLELKNGSYTKTMDLTLNKVPCIAQDDFTYSSSNTQIASVDGTGKVTFNGQTGTVTITVKSVTGNITRNVTFYVKIPVSSLVINRSPVELRPGETYNRAATVNPSQSNAQNYVVYSSNNTQVATVDQNGKVTAKSHGVAKISASIAEDYTSTGTSITASYYVYVRTPLENVEIVGPDECTLEFDTVRYSYNLIPANTNDGITATWSSSNTNVATIDNNGNVTLKDTGYVTFTLQVKGQGALSTNTITKTKTLIVNSIYEPAFLKGDLDRNGVVNANDASVALELYKGQNADSMDIKIGDMDENGLIDANDASLILEYYKTQN